MTNDPVQVPIERLPTGTVIRCNSRDYRVEDKTQVTVVLDDGSRVPNGVLVEPTTITLPDGAEESV